MSPGSGAAAPPSSATVTLISTGTSRAEPFVTTVERREMETTPCTLRDAEVMRAENS